MIGYMDSSVLLHYLLTGNEGFRQVLTCDLIVSSELLTIECRRVMHRNRLIGNLDDVSFYNSSILLDEILKSVSLLSLSSEIKQRASESFPLTIKTLDALHLSSALIFHNRRPDERLLIFSFDKQFNRCARALGFTAPFSIDP